MCARYVNMFTFIHPISLFKLFPVAHFSFQTIKQHITVR